MSSIDTKGIVLGSWVKVLSYGELLDLVGLTGEVVAVDDGEEYPLSVAFYGETGIVEENFKYDELEVTEVE